LAVASSFKDRRVEPRTVAIGEIGLSGELRSVGQLERRLIEAKRLGFDRAIIPASTPRQEGTKTGLATTRVGSLGEAIETALA
jgi:DNA repair protein RadA/Sms